MKIYENIVIGNFLYALGLEVGKRINNTELYSVVSLLQQTKLDTALGDVLLETPGIVRLIEFKRRENNSSKEKLKHATLHKAISDNPELIAISRSIHWFIETASHKSDLTSKVVPYLDAFPDKNSDHSLFKFIELTAIEAIKPKHSFCDSAIAAYLALVGHLSGIDTSDCGGLLLKVSSSGSVEYTDLVDIGYLTLTTQEIIHTLSQQNLRKKQIERTLTLQQSNNIEMGYSR